MLGGPQAEAAAPLLQANGLQVELLGRQSAQRLREADRAGLRYVLVHVGSDDGEPEGSFARAHHRVTLDQVPGLAQRIRPRDRPRVTCLAFAYKRGLPEDPTWLVDVRFLDNPYWVEELRPLSGRDAAVAGFVLAQPAAQELLARLEPALRWAIPLYERDDLTIAFGCTGGRHRSVAIAAEMARRLADMDEVDVAFQARDLE